MKPPLFECVPNFSEGRNPEVLQEIRQAAEMPGVYVLGWDSDIDHNRSVLTLVGEAAPLVEAVYRTCEVAVSRIDLRHHHGVHPRLGAVDVVPFVPWQQASMAGAVNLAYQLGRQVALSLNLPVYYYEHAARRPHRENLAEVRRGQFEGLADRMQKDPPDEGPLTPHPTAGAVAIGAREVLVAFNVDLMTESLEVAKKVAARVRQANGGLTGVKALGLALEQQKRVQVSMNLVDLTHASIPEALQAVKRQARLLGVEVGSTEIVGLIPMRVWEEIARQYLGFEGFDRQRVLEWALVEAQGGGGHSEEG